MDALTPSFLSIFEALVPAEEEIAKQKQLLLSLQNLVNKEWPNARLHLYGSCANSFGVSNSDIDVCLAIDDADINKLDILLKLADVLQSGNLQNVQVNKNGMSLAVLSILCICSMTMFSILCLICLFH